MKKIAIALVCMIMATGAAMAQKTFTFGPKVGVDYTHYWGKDVGHGGQLNYQAGLFMEYRFNDKFSIAPEVVFAAQGGKYDDEINFSGLGHDILSGLGLDIFSELGKVNVSVTDHVNYINIPVMLKFYVIPHLSIDFGPQLGINVYGKYTAKAKNSADEFKKTFEMKDNPLTDAPKTIDFGLGLGLTYNITDEIFVQGRYTMGLTKVFEEKNFKHNDKNGNAQIAIGYRF